MNQFQDNYYTRINLLNVLLYDNRVIMAGVRVGVFRDPSLNGSLDI